jgi:hypothetical protein
MAHNSKAGGSRGGGSYTRPTNLNNKEAQILADNNILIPPAWHLPHDWHVSDGGYTIEQHWEALPLLQRDRPEWAPTRVI